MLLEKTNAMAFTPGVFPADLLAVHSTQLLCQTSAAIALMFVGKFIFLVWMSFKQRRTLGFVYSFVSPYEMTTERS